jgi:DNA-directed RNA polymerase specialized sigma24 family protein
VSTNCVVLAYCLQYPTTWLHELGHNLYMNHAGSYQDNRGGSMQVRHTHTHTEAGHTSKQQDIRPQLAAEVRFNLAAAMGCLPSQEETVLCVLC